MGRSGITFVTGAVLVTVFFVAAAFSQRPRPTPAAPATKPIIFAVLTDGTLLEPIALVDRGKLLPTVNGSDPPGPLAAFHKQYYRKGTSYRLIFGGADSGTTRVLNSNPTAECSKNIANVATRSTKTPLKGLVMGLATNASIATRPSIRRRPTPEEKSEADALARSEFRKEKLTPDTLRYHNLTALDFENDGKIELVGSYWVEIDRLTRGLLFFIAAKTAAGKFGLGYSEFRRVDQANVMSGEIRSVDEGVYHELLLDVFDFDRDGTSEVFTYTQSFEGAGFTVYKKKGEKWDRVFEGSNYHCGY